MKNYHYKWYPTQNQNFIETIKNNKLTLKSIYYENDYLIVAFYIAIDMPYRIVFKEGLTPYQVSTKKYFDKIDKNMIEDNNWNFFYS
ncbi:MAG: hypothetical protein LBG21_00715 [Campylobacteraceae bacterium]|nr:hypothetical protein [Campylobacteraceae bacterium]